MDRIELRGLRVLVHVGVPEAERAAAQPVEVDLDLHLPLEAAAHADDVQLTADYGQVADAVVLELENEPAALLERLAARVVDVVFSTAPRVEAVDVTVRKLRVPVAAHVASAAVHLHRRRDGSG